MDEDSIQIDANDMKDVEQVDQPDSTAEDSSTEENNSSEVVEGFDDEPDTSDKETDGDKEEEANAEDSEEADDTDSDDKPRAKNAAENRIRTLANENRELKQKLDQVINQVYAPANEQDLVDQGYNESDAKVEALRQQIEVDRFNRQVGELNTSLNSEASQVLQDFPMFNPESKEYNEQLAQKAQTLYQRAAGIQTDPNTGLVINANVLPYDFYQSFAETYEAGASTGKVSGQKATEKMLANVDAPSSAPPKEPKKDAFLAGFDSL